MARTHLLAVLCVFFNSACAALYKVQLSDLTNISGGKRVSVKVSEMTVDFGEASRLAKELGQSAGSKGLGSLGNAAGNYEAFFQFGPRTGTPVFNEFYARDVPERLAAECKAGYLTNITSIRESRDYPLIKGQIVRIDASCFQP
jgi:hypothetical protein